MYIVASAFPELEKILVPPVLLWAGFLNELISPTVQTKQTSFIETIKIFKSWSLWLCFISSSKKEIGELNLGFKYRQRICYFQAESSKSVKIEAYKTPLLIQSKWVMIFSNIDFYILS